MKQTIQEDLQQRPVWRLLIKYSGPAVIESVAVSLYNIVDSIFIGHDEGAMSLAALAIALPLMNLVVAFCTLIATGGASVVSIRMGRKDIKGATAALNSVLALCLIHALVFGGLMLIFLDPVLVLFGATDATLGLARRYMRIILLGTPIAYVFLGLNNIMRASGYPRKAMVSALLSVVVNVIMCYLFINRWHWSMEGAALATLCGQTAALVWCVSHFMSKDSLIHFNFKLKWFRSDIVGRAYAIGLAPFLMGVCACIVVVFLNHALLIEGKSMGNYFIGAYGIINRVTMVFIMVVQGLSIGMQPILGFNYGARQWDRIRHTLHIGIFMGATITTIGWILTECFPDMMSAIFTTSTILENIDHTAFRIYFLCYPVVGAQIIIQNYFQYVDHPKYSIMLSMTRQMIFLLPFLLFLPRLLGVNGVWWSMSAANILAFLVSVIALKYVKIDNRPEPLSSAAS